MDDHPITPRRALPPVPPPGRQAGTATLAPAMPPAMDHTSWFDPLDPMNDSAVHPALTGFDALDDGTAAKAARDLIRESGRQPVLDEALLAALDAAAKAAEARRAVTLAVPPSTAASLAVQVPAPASVPAPRPALDRTAVTEPAPAAPVVAAPVVVEPALDISAEFARHDDLVETGRHASVTDDEWVYDSGPQPAVTETGRHLAVDVHEDDEDDEPLTHRTVITRSSGRRWIPAGVGVGVVAIVGAVLLTSGFGADASSTGTDEAARTGASTSDSATAPATTPALPTPAMNTLDLSGPMVVDTEDVDQPILPSARSSAAVQPQVAAPPAARTSTQAPAAVSSPNGTGTGDGSTTPPATLTASTTTTTTEPSTQTATSQTSSTETSSN